MDWCKTNVSDFYLVTFLSSILSVQTLNFSSVFFPLFALLLSLFSQKQSAKQNTGESFPTKLKSTCKNSGTFEVKQISPERVTYASLASSHSIMLDAKKIV